MGVRTIGSAAATAAMLLLATTATSCAADGTDLGRFGASVDINDAGTVAICQRTAEEYGPSRALVIDADGARHELVGPDPTSNCAEEIDDAGRVLGRSGSVLGVWQPDGSWAPLPLPADSHSPHVNDMNDTGIAVGHVRIGADDHGVRWDLNAGTVTSLPLSPRSPYVPPSDVPPRGWLVNDAGTIVALGTSGWVRISPTGELTVLSQGLIYFHDIDDHGDLLWSAQQKASATEYRTVHGVDRSTSGPTITIPGATDHVLIDLNDDHELVGWAEIGGVRRAIRYNVDTGELRTFGPEDGGSSTAYAINDHGEAVGITVEADGTNRLHVWR